TRLLVAVVICSGCGGTGVGPTPRVAASAVLATAKATPVETSSPSPPVGAPDSVVAVARMAHPRQAMEKIPLAQLDLSKIIEKDLPEIGSALASDAPLDVVVAMTRNGEH